MKSKENRLTFFSIVLIFGLVLVGNLDAQSDSSLNGTWVVTFDDFETEITFNNGNFEVSGMAMIEGIQGFSRGTYAARDGILSMSTTHIMFIGQIAEELGLESTRWYTINEYIILMTRLFASLGLFQDEIDEINQMLDLATSQSLSYSVVNNSLITTGTIDGEKHTLEYTRK